MKKISIAVISIFIFAIFCEGQSGRRIRAKATPKPTTIVKPEDTYSESRSYKPRRIYPPNYRKKGKKETVKDAKIATSEPDGADDVIQVDATLVTIPVSIYNKNGLYITDITKEEIKIFEDGKEQEIAYFRISEKAFTVALLIDTSPSTEYKIREIRQAAKAFVRQLNPQDKVLVMEFDGDPQILSEATTNRDQINRAIDKADFGGGTALYDAVDYAINRRLNSIEGRKAIVLFTDGVDTVSRRTYDSSLDDAEESGTIIFPIYYNTFGRYGSRGGVYRSPIPGLGGGNQGRGTSAEEYALGKKYLDDLAAYTGGRVFQPERSVRGLTDAFEGIAEELRRQYSLGYYPKKEGSIGERKKIKVRVYRPRLIVRARDSYIVGSNRRQRSRN